MLAKGNSSPEICLLNILNINRGEVFFDRLKGFNTELFDRNSSLASPEAVRDMLWLAETYEPRVYADEAYVKSLMPKTGNFTAGINISSGGTSNG